MKTKVLITEIPRGYKSYFVYEEAIGYIDGYVNTKDGIVAIVVTRDALVPVRICYLRRIKDD